MTTESWMTMTDPALRSAPASGTSAGSVPVHSDTRPIVVDGVDGPPRVVDGVDGLARVVDGVDGQTLDQSSAGRSNALAAEPISNDTEEEAEHGIEADLPADQLMAYVSRDGSVRAIDAQNYCPGRVVTRWKPFRRGGQKGCTMVHDGWLWIAFSPFSPSSLGDRPKGAIMTFQRQHPVR